MKSSNTDHRMIRRTVFLLFAIFFFVNYSYSQVELSEGSITIPTYGWEDDVNPKFWAMEAGAKGATTVKASITYPYNMQDHLSRELKDVTYRAIFMENEYLKITCLPDLGGRLHSVFDKTTNQEAFHRNDVIKPSMIAMRGGFISGGIEWNAGPQVHTVTILSPVDVTYGKNDDGSAYIEVSNLEKSLRTRWTVRVTLHPGKSVLDEDIRIYNPTDAMNPYYFWNCTAFPQLEGTRFIYPMSRGTDHFGMEYFDWPIHNGVDISWTKNYEEASSIFAVDCAYDFFGAYDVNIDRGIVQVANHHEHQGKKAWTWGQGEYGRVSMINLGDKDPEYIEVQSGPLQTQSDYGLLQPGGSISWKEYWYPIHGLNNGFEFATRHMAIQTNRNESDLNIRIIPTERIPGAVCRVFSGDDAKVKRLTGLSPSKANTLSFSGISSDTVLITIEGNNGEVLAEFRSPLPLPEVEPIPVASYVNKDDDDLSVEETYLKAQKSDRALNRLEARRYYQAVLKTDPLNTAALRDLGILDFEAGLYSDAANKFDRALKQIPNDDGLAWYFLGLCQLRENNIQSALKCGFKASRCQGTVARGYDLVGRAYMMQNNYKDAITYFSKAYRSDLNDPMLYHHFLLARYANNERNSSVNEFAKRNKEYPTELLPALLLAITDKDTRTKIKQIRHIVGEDDFELFETSLVFSDLGMYDEAIKVLEKSCIEPLKTEDQSHLIQYQLAWLYNMTGDKKSSEKYLGKASGNYQDFVLASRPEIEKTLLYAISENKNDAIAHYQLGNLYANFGRLKEAEKHWNISSESDPGLSITWRNLGLLNWVVNNNHKSSEKCYRNAIKNRPFDQTLYRDLAKVLDDDSRTPEAISLLEKMKYEGAKRSDIVIDLAQYYLQEKQWDKCIDLLESAPYFVNWEGSAIVWNQFNKANVEKGLELYNKGTYKKALKSFNKALTWPENLGVGRSMRTEEAMSWYWKGKTLESMGNSMEAQEAWKAGSVSLGNSEKQLKYKQLCHDQLK